MLAVAALVTVALLSVMVGAKPIPLVAVFDAMFAYDAALEDHVVVWGLRIPRTLVGLVVGAALGVAGTLTQALTRNPLADPGLLGINQGAALGVVTAVGLLGLTSPWAYVWFTFAGAALAAVAVYAVVVRGREGASPVRVLLAGVAITYVLHGLVDAIVLHDPQLLDRYRNWIIGSLASSQLTDLVALTPFLLAGGLLAFGLSRALNALALGDEAGHALGVRRARIRAGAGIAVTLLCGAATALAGPLVFVGLVVPYAARLITGPDYRWLMAYSVVLAPVLVLASDVLGRVHVRPGEVTVGVVVSFVGAPVLIALVRRRGRLPRL